MGLFQLRGARVFPIEPTYGTFLHKSLYFRPMEEALMLYLNKHRLAKGVFLIVWLYFVCSYLVGSIMFGYIVTKAFYQQDLRKLGSGNVGARNAGRLHGKKVFVMTFLGDASKGAVVVAAARWLHFSDSFQLIGLMLAVIGHLKPITLKFKGGKGISTFIGGMITFQPLLSLVILAGFIILYPLTKSFTLAGLGAFLFIPVFLLIRQYDWLTCILAAGILILILLAHSENIKEKIRHS